MPALFDTGFTVREAAWHGMATVLDNPPATWEEFRVHAGLEWEPVTAPIFGEVGLDPATGMVLYEREKNAQKIIRSDTGKRLAITTEEYNIIGHDAMGEIANTLLAQDEVELWTGGSLREGQSVWALFKLGEGIQVKNDPSKIMPFVAALNSHDGSGALKFIATTYRIVCANTWNAADAEASTNGTVATIYHSKNWKDRIEDARVALTGAREQFEGMAEWFNFLADVPVTDAQLDEFVKLLFWPKDQEASIGPIVLKHIETAVAAFTGAYQSVTCEGIRGTAHGVLQALGEYRDHLRPYTRVDADARRDQGTNRSLLNTDNYKYKGAQILGDVLGRQLVAA